MIRSLCRCGVLLVGFVLIGAGRLSAEQSQAWPDTRRSLQIPPQDILQVESESTASFARAPAAPQGPATRPAVEVADPGRRISAPERLGTDIRPNGTAAGNTAKESRLIARTADPERAAAGTRSVESKEVSRGLPGARLGSVRDLLPLLSVLALILVMAWIVRKALPRRQAWTGSGVIEVLSRTSLSSKQSLILVRMGRRLLLLGVTGDEMNTLCVVEDPDQVAMLVGESASAGPNSMTRAFARAFAEEARAYQRDRTEETNEDAETGEPVRRLLNKVRHLTSRRNVA